MNPKLGTNIGMAIVAVVAALAAPAALAATGTSDAATSMDGISTAFKDFLSGSGGSLILAIGVIVAAAQMWMRPNWGVAGGILGSAALVGYGIPAMEGFGSVSQTIPMYLPDLAALSVHLPPSV